MHRIIKNLKYLVILCFFVSRLALASSFVSSSCVEPPPGIPSDGYLTYTAYGYIKNYIDMTSSNVTDACNQSTSTLNFCLKNATGSNPICKAISLNTGDTKTLGQLSGNPDLISNQYLAAIPLTVSQIGSYICLNMPTSRGEMALACKNTTITPPATTTTNTSQCSNIGQACTGGATGSQSIFNFSGLAVQCLKETLDKVFYQQNFCVSGSASDNLLNPFASFQASLKNSVFAALIIYVIFFGFRIIMQGGVVDLGSIVTFVFKFLLVAYFSVGLGPSFFQNGTMTVHNGMLEYGLPILSQISLDFAQMVFNAAGNEQGLCTFDPSKYSNGNGFYAVWDAIDCRIAYYFGVKLMYNLDPILSAIGSNASSSGGSYSPINWGTFNTAAAVADLGVTGNICLLTLTFAFLLGGQILIVIMLIIFVIILMSILLHFITSYLVCLITLYVMAYVAPIFIPMALFEKTKGYFDAWLKITISCALQPMVLAGFIAICMTLFDSAIFGSCQFVRHDYSFNGDNFSTFELGLPSTSPENCTNSAGYKLMQYYMGQGWSKVNLILFQVPLVAADTLDILNNLLYVLVFSFIFYFFSQSMSEFAASITNGPVMSGMVAGPTKIIDAAMNAASKANKYAKAIASKGRSTGRPNSTNRASTTGGGESKGGSAKSAEDKVSS